MKTRKLYYFSVNEWSKQPNVLLSDRQIRKEIKCFVKMEKKNWREECFFWRWVEGKRCMRNLHLVRAESIGCILRGAKYVLISCGYGMKNYCKKHSDNYCLSLAIIFWWESESLHWCLEREREWEKGGVNEELCLGSCDSEEKNILRTDKTRNAFFTWPQSLVLCTVSFGFSFLLVYINV